MAVLEFPQPTRLVPDLVASVSTEAAAAVIALRGEADIATVPVIVDSLARVTANHDGPVVVDLAHLDFIDSATVDALERAWQFLDARGRRLTLRSPSPIAVRVLAIFKLSHLVEPAGAVER